AADSAFGCRANPDPLHRIADQVLQRLGERDRAAWRNQQSGYALLDQLRNSRNAGRNTREPLALRFDQYVGEAIPITVPSYLGRQHEEVGLTIRGEYARLCYGATPFDPV